MMARNCSSFLSFQSTGDAEFPCRDWRPVIAGMGASGWELATIVQTPILLQSSFTTYTIKLLMIFQRRLFVLQRPIKNGTETGSSGCYTRNPRIIIRTEPGYYNHSLQKYVSDLDVLQLEYDDPSNQQVAAGNNQRVPHYEQQKCLSRNNHEVSQSDRSNMSSKQRDFSSRQSDSATLPVYSMCNGHAVTVGDGIVAHAPLGNGYVPRG